MASSEEVHALNSAGNEFPGSFFSVPSIASDPDYRDIGNTKVTWTPGYFQYVKFVPWDDFEGDVWREAMRKFENLDATTKGVARSRLNTARDMVFRARYHGNVIFGHGHEQNQSFVASGAEGANPPREPSADEEEVEPAELPRVHANSSKYWTNSASIAPVTSTISTALEYLFYRYLGVIGKEGLYQVRCAKEKRIATGDIKDDSGQNLLVTVQQQIVADVSVQLDLITNIKKRKTPSAYFTRILPLCNFETKGPTLDLSGIDASRRWLENQQKIRNKKKGGGPSNEGSPELPAEARVDPPVEPSPPGMYTPADVAANFNFLFSDPLFLETSHRENGSLRDSIYRVSQTVTNAVLSLGGCAFMHNMTTGIGFKVAERNGDNLVVKVTGVMRSDVSPNCVSAMFATGAHCIDEYFSEHGNTLPSKVIDVAKAISKRATNRENIPTKQGTHENPPAGGGTGEGGKAGATGASSAQAVLSLETHLGSDFISLVVDGLDASEKARMSPSTVRTEPCLLDAEQISLKIDNASMDMFMYHDGVVGRGSSGVVYKSRLMGKVVAVKIPYDNCPPGTAAFREEMKVYLDLRRQRSPLLGDVLPGFVVAWDKPSVNSVYGHIAFLVTDYVGRSLHRDKPGNLIICDSTGANEKVDSSEEPAICDSALLGLQRLRDCGRLHGDVALRNLRAERIQTTFGVVWKTWWVDLGLSTTIQSRMDARLYAIDRMDTRALFKLNSDD